MPSTRRLLDDTLVDFHTGHRAPTLVQLDQKAVAVAAHAAHSVVAMEDGTFRTFENLVSRAAGVPWTGSNDQIRATRASPWSWRCPRSPSGA